MQAVETLEPRSVARLLLWIDLFALIVLGGAVGAMLAHVYSLGATAAAPGPAMLADRDRVFFRIVATAFVAGLAAAWIAYRFLRATTLARRLLAERE
ncbi:MAG TPA: hypothetical protein VM681_02500 [Candidatus Thermoplasmatota archaeon]|nr:hypothetical protein [Candidatus Thermoplasmatota archaeon]